MFQLQIEARKRLKNINKRMKSKQEMMDNFYFTSLDWISYPLTSYFNMYIQNFHLKDGTIQTDVINLREILNIYIAEGYYKFQTDYVNSKLSYSDIKSLCQFVVHKMKTSNFLNLIKSQISGNNEGFSQKFSIEENIRQKANYMKRVKSNSIHQDNEMQPRLSQQDRLSKHTGETSQYQKREKSESVIVVFSKITVLDPQKGIILKSSFIPSQKEFKFVVLETNNKNNTTRYKPYDFFSQQVQFLDQYLISQNYKEVLNKVVIFFKNQMMLYHKTSA